MHKDSLEYYTSERFIHDHLVELAGNSIQDLYRAWAALRRIDPFIVAWPSETLLSREGLPVGVCLLELPLDRALWSKKMLEFVRTTKAYALLLVEQEKDHVSAILESHHGTRSWEIPIQASGDLYVLGLPKVKDDTHRIGLLWSPKTTHS